MANAAPLIAGGFALYVLARLLGRSSTEQAPERQNLSRAQPGSIVWPIDETLISRYGDSVMEKRPGSGKPHKGIDIFADARTLVRASQGGTVVRVVDGRKAVKETSRAAGLWVDIKGSDDLVYRYLHLGDSYVKDGQKIAQGHPIGIIAEAYTSGLADKPHLHFEIRNGDFTTLRDDYGMPIDPLTRLPNLRRKG